MNILKCLLLCLILFFCNINGQGQTPNSEVEELPPFPGCEELITLDEKKKCAAENMLQYIYKNLKYPAEARKMGIQGRAVVSYDVDADGTLVNMEIIVDPGGGCGEEAVRIIESMNHMEDKWIAGHQEGKPVKIKYTLPILFKLDSGSKAKSDKTKLLNVVIEELAGKSDFAPRFENISDACNSDFITCDGKRIIGLDFQFADLRGTIPSEITSLKDLVWINLEYNYLQGGIPFGLSNLPQLEELLINGNHLTGEKPVDYDRLDKLYIFDETKNVAYLDVIRSGLTEAEEQQKFNELEEKSSPDEVFMVVERMPRFPGCESLAGNEDDKLKCSYGKLMEFVSKNLKYPSLARNLQVEGKVVVQFVLLRSGMVDQITIKRDPGSRCGNAAAWVVDRMNYMPERWIPGVQKDELVKELYTLPLNFEYNF